MALIHSDGFDSHGAAGALVDGDPKWVSQSGLTVTAAIGKFAGNGLRRVAATLGYAGFVNGGTQKGFAFYAKPVAAFGGAAEASLLETAAAGKLVTVDNTGIIKVYDGGGNLRITSAAAALPALANYWIEADYLTGQINLLVNGVLAGSYTGAYTSAGTTFRLGGAAPANTPQFDFDDFMTWDDSGSYFNTFGLTPRRIQLVRPNAAGDFTQWTPASGTNWAAVDDTDWSGGVGVSATAAGLKDTYGMTDLAVSPASINAVVVRSKVQNTGDNPATLQHVLRGADGSETLSTAQAVPTVAASVLTSTFYRDPNGAPWVPSTVNAVQAGTISG